MTDDELRALLERMAEAEIPVPPPTADLRARHVDAMLRGTLVQPDRARPRRRLLAYALVATLVAAPALALWRARPAPPIGTLQASGSTLVLRHDEAALVGAAKTHELRAGERVVTLAGATAVASVDGAIATLSPRGELGVASAAGVSCELRAGRARFVVAKRGGKPPFVVRVADLDVVVHGTTFEVWLDAEGRPHVRVEEGSVGVTRPGAPMRELHASQSFPEQASAPNDAVVIARPPELPPGESARPQVQRTVAQASASPSPAGHASLPGGAVPADRTTPEATASASASAVPVALRSQLREQNDLLWEAAEARRHGDLDRERRALEAFDRRFPNAPGSHDARAAALRRAVASGDHAAAKEAARAYLAAHPDGPLRSEALAVH